MGSLLECADGERHDSPAPPSGNTSTCFGVNHRHGSLRGVDRRNPRVVRQGQFLVLQLHIEAERAPAQKRPTTKAGKSVSRIMNGRIKSLEDGDPGNRTPEKPIRKTGIRKS